jgi:outer membrane lipoprotein LolB
MRKLLFLMTYCVALSACVTTRPALAPAPWERRASDLQHANVWQLDGRAAVAVGTQGWQASLNWRQNGVATEVHLAGPLGIGAVVLKKTAAGLSMNDAPPSDAVLMQLQDRLGFELPLDNLRYWLLGVPDPGSPFELARNDQDRARQLTQAGWTVDYDRYMPVSGDLLPAHLVLSREGTRVRIAVDHWVLGH